MHSKFFLPLAAAILVLCTQCGVDTDKPSTDSTNTHGLTVSGGNGITPHVVKDTVKNGTHVERYENGVIYITGEMKNGLREGTWLSFYKDGKKWSEGIYKDGFREGHGVSYYANGTKSSEGEYSHDRMIGKWTFWDEYGNMTTKDFPAK